MRTINTTLSALGLGLLLCSSGACERDRDGSRKSTSGNDSAPERQTDATKQSDRSSPEASEQAPSRPPASKHTLVNEYVVCVESCAGGAATERPTCHQNCAVTVSAGGGDPSAVECSRGCAEMFGSCLLTCYDKSTDDSATCRRQCQQLADKCVDACV